MNEEILQNMSRALTHLVFCNGIVEELHCEGRCMDKTINYLAKYYGKGWDKAEKWKY